MNASEMKNLFFNVFLFRALFNSFLNSLCFFDAFVLCDSVLLCTVQLSRPPRSSFCRGASGRHFCRLSVVFPWLEIFSC